MNLYARGIDLTSIYNFSIGLWNCSDSMVLFVFHFMVTLFFCIIIFIAIIFIDTCFNFHFHFFLYPSIITFVTINISSCHGTLEAYIQYAGNSCFTLHALYFLN